MNGSDRTQGICGDGGAEECMSRVPENGDSGERLRSVSVEMRHDGLPSHGSTASTDLREGLGEPLAIEQVAALLGCSAWTVRQCYLRQGLPHLQARPRGKLVFFRDQVIAWIEKRQRQKGGISR